MREVLRVKAQCPDGKQRETFISLSKYTLEQAKQIAEEWKTATRQGQKYVRPKFEKPKDKIVQPIQPELDKVMVKRKSFDAIQPDFSNGGVSFLCLGSTKSGKSVCVNALYDKFFKKHITVLMTLSSQAQIYERFHKNAIVSSGYHSQVLKDMMKINKETKNHYKFCMIFDDLALEGKTSRDMTTALTIGRNFNTSVIYSAQKMSMLNATGRANLNYILCFKQNTDSAIEDTIKTYMRSYFPPHLKMPELIRLYREYTHDHNFFVIDTLNNEMFICKIEYDE